MNYNTFKPETSFLLCKPSLKVSILNKNAKIDPKILDDLELLVSKYNLSWVPSSTGTGAYFLSSEVLKAIGKDDSYFKIKWNNSKPDVVKTYLIYGEYPRLKNVKGAPLTYIKEAWLHYNKTIIDTINDIWVLEWSVVHWLLTTVIVDNLVYLSKDTKVAINQSSGACVGRETDEYLYSDYLEDGLRTRIMELASYQSRYKLVQEFTLDNNDLKTSTNKAASRRIDILQYGPKRSYIAYELKLDEITSDHVKETLGDKGYLELLRNRFKGRKIKFYFMSPKGITPEAKRLINNNPYVDFIPVSKFVNKLIAAIRTETPDCGLWYYLKSIDRLFPRNNCIKKDSNVA